MLLLFWSEQILFRCFCCRTFPQSSAGALKSEMSHRFWWKIEKFKSLISFISLFTCSCFCRWSDILKSIKLRNYVRLWLDGFTISFFLLWLIGFWNTLTCQINDANLKIFFRKILPTRFFHLNKVLPTRFFVQIRVHQKKKHLKIFRTSSIEVLKNNFSDNLLNTKSLASKLEI